MIRRELGFEAAQRLVASGEGTVLMNRVRSILADIEREQLKFLAERQRREREGVVPFERQNGRHAAGAQHRADHQHQPCLQRQRQRRGIAPRRLTRPVESLAAEADLVITTAQVRRASGNFGIGAP